MKRYVAFGRMDIVFIAAIVVVVIGVLCKTFRPANEPAPKSITVVAPEAEGFLGQPIKVSDFDDEVIDQPSGTNTNKGVETNGVIEFRDITTTLKF